MTQLRQAASCSRRQPRCRTAGVKLVPRNTPVFLIDPLTNSCTTATKLAPRVNYQGCINSAGLPFFYWLALPLTIYSLAASGCLSGAMPGTVRDNKNFGLCI